MLGRLFVAIVIVLSLARFTFAADDGVVILVTMEGVSLEQLAQWDLPAYRTLFRTGAAGLLTCRTGGDASFDNAAVTIGAGAPALGVASRPEVRYARRGFNLWERSDGAPASQTFARNTGLTPPPAGIVHTGIAALGNLNAGGRHAVTPGLLGETLAAAGVAVSVFGNSDLGTMSARSATAIAMDRQGRVPDGDVSRDTLVRDPLRPFGVRMNYPYLLQRVTARTAGRRFIVVEAGDAGRAQAAAMECTPEQYAAYQRMAAAECGQFLLALDAHLQAAGTRYLLLLVVTNPDAVAVGNDQLLPVIMTGTGIPAGLLTSGTTRRPGIITVLDLAPTVLQHFAVPVPPEMLGRPVQAGAMPDAVPALLQMNREILGVYMARRPILKGYCILLLIAAILGLGLALASRLTAGAAWLPRLSGLLQCGLLALMLVPLLLLLAPALGIFRVGPLLTLIIPGSLALGFLVQRGIRDLRGRFALVGLLTALAVCGDLLWGAPLIKHSVLGYDPIAGARFYGIGNEFTGVLIGAMLLGVYALADRCAGARWTVPLAAAGTAAALALLALPGYGTNFGGMISAAPAFAVALVKVGKRLPRRVVIGILCAAALALVGLLLAVNLLAGNGSQSHIGRAFAAARQEGWAVLADFAVRKWAMEWMLIRNSTWTPAFAGMAASVLLLLLWPGTGMPRALRQHRALNAGFVGIAVSLPVALATNDSGIVMAVMAMVYLALPVLMLGLAGRADARTPATVQPSLPLNQGG